MNDPVIPPISNQTDVPFGAVMYVRWAARLLREKRFRGISEIGLLESNSSFECGSVLEELGLPSDAAIPGFYFFETPTKPASIGLAIPDIYSGIPFPLSATPIMVIVFARILSHEVLHHRFRDRTSYDEKKEEERAWLFSNRFEELLVRSPWFRFWRWILADLASWHYAWALADVRAGETRKAEKRFYVSCILDHRNKDAAEWYWRLRSCDDKDISKDS